MKIFKLSGFIAMFVIVLAGCGPTAHIERADNVNFNRYRTFAWAQKSERGSRADLTEVRIKEAISAELERTQGWNETTRNPDVILSYDVLVERSSRPAADPVYSWGGFRSFYNPYSRRFYRVYYPSTFIGYDHYEVPTREGTITITMVDTDNDRTVLQGWATDEISGRRLTSAEVNRIVRSIFRKWNMEQRNSRTTRNNRYYGK